MTELESLIREAWKATALEMGDAILGMSWISHSSSIRNAPEEDDEMPLAA